MMHRDFSEVTKLGTEVLSRFFHAHFRSPEVKSVAVLAQNTTNIRVCLCGVLPVASVDFAESKLKNTTAKHRATPRNRVPSELCFHSQ